MNYGIVMTRAGIGTSYDKATELMGSGEDIGHIYHVGQSVAAIQINDGLH